MNEEIKENEIAEEELEEVSGGVGRLAAPRTCSKCGGVVFAGAEPIYSAHRYFCPRCNREERA